VRKGRNREEEEDVEEEFYSEGEGIRSI